MARHPAWFARLDTILEVARAGGFEALGRVEIGALFQVSERDSIRLLHQFGATERGNALSLPRSGLIAQLEAVRAGASFAAYTRQRQGVAKELAAARAETAARQFRVRPAPPPHQRVRFEDLPATIAWRRTSSAGPGRFEIRYDDGADLLWQISEFLAAAGVNRNDFVAATEPLTEVRTGEKNADEESPA